MKTSPGTRRPSARWCALLVAITIAAGGAAAATAGGGGLAKQVAALKHQVATLKHQVATLKAQNKRLNDQFSPPGITRQLAKTKKALDKYQSVDAAKADGYAPASPCESTPINPDQTSFGGAMGIHYVNGAILASGNLDPAKPPILVYLPTAGGALELVAAEYFKPDADQNLQTDDDRPSLFGRAFDGPMEGHNPPGTPAGQGMPRHYDLHVWLWKHNPSGIFAPYNPAVSCPA
jgi:hypothetical protein